MRSWIVSADKQVEIGWRRTELIDWTKLKEFQGELKSLSKENYERLKKSILKNRFSEPFTVWEDENGKLNLLNGHQRLRGLLMMQNEGYHIPDKLPVSFVIADNLKQAKSIVLSLASQYGEVTKDGLYEFAHHAEMSFEEMKDTFHFPEVNFNEYEDMFEKDPQDKTQTAKLADVFGAPPFSVLDTRQGYWVDRKREWESLGISSEEGRDTNLMHTNNRPESFKTGYDKAAPGTSIFDPVLAELSYKWYCPKGGLILDQFAGGSVRGIVASKAGYKYKGIDLSENQVLANKKQGKSICDDMPVWIVDDSLNTPRHIDRESVDMLFTCPPYADLEVYSDDPKDISNMAYGDFMSAFSQIIKHGYDALKNDRFAVMVVGEVRDKKSGNYRGFVPDTIKAHEAAGFVFYNEAILVNQFGTAAMRAAKTFIAGRKLIKCHQNVLVFIKGSAKKASEYMGPCEGLADLDIASDE